jgi:hypothetical protein
MSNFAIRPHPLAPLFSLESNPSLVLQQLLEEATSGNFNTGEKILSMIRQAGYVSLWFFLKVIAGYAGPYDQLNEGIHLEMCNFRQSDYCMSPNARFAAFLFRKARKSTIFTHGGNTWELLRDPNLRIELVNAVLSRAVDFKRITQLTFQSNDLLRELYPSYCPVSSSQPRWNEKEIVMPNRTRFFIEPSIKPLGVGSATEGDHPDLMIVDDAIGLEDMDVMQMSNTDMIRKIQWLKATEKTLLNPGGRFGIVGTRYGADDLYQFVVDTGRKVVGYPMQGFKPNPKGRWVIYHRLPIEDGVEVQPEAVTKQDLEEMLEEGNVWTVMTQFYNNPMDSGLAEFVNLEVKKASLRYETGPGFIITFHDEEESEEVRLEEMDCVMAVDPAGTDKNISARTSRTAIEAWAEDYKERLVLLWSRVGYFSIHETFNHIFEGVEYLKGSVRTVGVEANAMQKILLPLLESERRQRDVWVSFTPANAGGDKVARIRSIVGRALQKGRVYVVDGQGLEFLEEVKIFPQGKYRMDALDAAEKAFSMLIRPLAPEETYAYKQQEEEFASGRNTTTGY